LNDLIDYITEIVAGLNEGNLTAGRPNRPPFVTCLVYKAAVIITGKLQNVVENKVKLQRLRALRSSLSITSQRWLTGSKSSI
jgi:hypothetical protein